VLIVLLLLAIIIYAGLYFAWDYMSGNLSTPTAWLASLNNMFLMPETQIFQLFRLLLFLIALYVFLDVMKVTTRKALKKKPPPEEMKLKSTIRDNANQ
jgi:hypothetical protein